MDWYIEELFKNCDNYSAMSDEFIKNMAVVLQRMDIII